MPSAGLGSEKTHNIIKDTEITTLLEEAHSLIEEVNTQDDPNDDQESDIGYELEDCTSENVLEELAVLTRNLIDLSSALERAVTDPEYVRETPAPPTDLTVAPYQFYSNCIREKSPQAVEDLIEYLA